MKKFETLLFATLFLSVFSSCKKQDDVLPITELKDNKTVETSTFRTISISTTSDTNSYYTKPKGFFPITEQGDIVNPTTNESVFKEVDGSYTNEDIMREVYLKYTNEDVMRD